MLTGNRTYSAAVILITDLLRHCNVIYVGELPASPSNFFSDSEYVGRLPNSEFWLWVASRQIDNAWSVEQQEFDKAVYIFEMNSKLFPDSANVYDSLGEAYLKGGNKAEALVHYRKSLELDPDNQTAINFIDSAGFLNQ